jgi:hypothetical protein
VQNSEPLGVIVRSLKAVFTNDENPVDQAGREREKSETHRNGFCVANKERKCLQALKEVAEIT